jgi:hypothetical protein
MRSHGWPDHLVVVSQVAAKCGKGAGQWWPSPGAVIIEHALYVQGSD